MVENDINSQEEERADASPQISPERSDAIEKPIVEAFPLTRYERYSLPREAMDALVTSNPDVIVKLIQEEQTQRREREDHMYQLERMRLENEQNLKLKREENKLKNRQYDSTIIRLGIGAFCGIFIGALVYAARVDDKNLPNTIITAAISLLAGGSTTIAFSKRDNSEDPNELSKINSSKTP